MAAPAEPVGEHVDQLGILIRDSTSAFFNQLDPQFILGASQYDREMPNLGAGGAFGGAGEFSLMGGPGAGGQDDLTRLMWQRTAKWRMKYVPQLHRIGNPGTTAGGAAERWTTVMIEWGDFSEHLSEVQVRAPQVLEKNFVRYEPFLNQGLREVMATLFPQRFAAGGQAGKESNIDTIRMAFYNVPQSYTVRTLRSSAVGELVNMTGTVTRTSQVRPELLVGVFKCNDCGTDSAPIEQQFRYTEPPTCRNEGCECKTRFTLNSDHKDTIFGDWQKLRVQENANEIPVGCMPRTMEVVLRNDAVEVAKPGDRVVLTGYGVAVPEVAKLFNAINRREVQRNLSGVQRAMAEDNQMQNLEGVTGLKALGVRDLNYRLCFYATSVGDHNGDIRKMTEAIKEASSAEATGMQRQTVQLTQAECAKIEAMNKSPSFFVKMARCVAPNIFRHDIIKTGILLQMVGGVPKTTMERISLRGDINCCIVGDPSTAKSQFLKWVAQNAPRGIYTSGKASTASGLTATVTRDVDTGERTIEAGALMLSDNGVCCIDEFDQMDTKDQVAIHEAMEQQTISIAKAGIKATLNARTSILAALNPLGGKYDRRKPLQKNIAMTAPIMSRFDLMFVVVDEANDESDHFMAQSVLDLHRFGEPQGAEAERFNEEDFHLYMKYARTLTPQMTEEAGAKIVEAYTQMRVQDSLSNRSKVYRVTTRLLESIIRLSEATAKLALAEKVGPDHVEVALSLMRQSLTTLDMTQVELVPGVDEEGGEVDSPGAAAEGDDGGAVAAGGGVTVKTEPKAKPPRKKQRTEQTQQQPAGEGDEAPPRAAGGPNTQQPAATTGGGGGTKKGKDGKQKMVINSEEFHLMVNKIITFVYKEGQRVERAAQQGGLPAPGEAPAVYPTADEVLKWMLTTVHTTDVDHLQRQLKVGELVIKRLKNEGKLLELDDNGVKRLCVDSNYNPVTD